jgi:predicted DNA-binding protein (UPF0251 family)
MSRLRAISDKEVEALRLLWDGLTQKEIAARLGVHRNTLTGRFARCRRKLRAATLHQATRQAVHLGILQP